MLVANSDSSCVHVPARARSNARLQRLCVQRTWLALLGAWLVWVVAVRAQAAPSLRVRAQVDIELHTHGTESGARISGVLRDDVGMPLPNRELTLAAETQDHTRVRSRSVRTDAEGKIDVPSPCGSNPCRITLELEGDAFYEHALVGHVVEPAKAEVELDIVEPSTLTIDLDRPETRVAVRASSEQGGARLPLVLEDELGRKLGSAITAADGSAELRVPSQQLGGAGLGELVVRTTGDADRTAARSSKAVLRTLGTQLELDTHYEAKPRTLRIAVRLRTRRGPVAQRAVGIFADDRHLTTLITDAQGDASRTLNIDALALAEGKHALLARFASDLPGLAASESKPVALLIEPVARPSSLWLVLPAIASMLFAWWSARRRRPDVEAAESSIAKTPEVRLGVVRARGAPLLTCSGKVEDADTSAPIEALLELESEQSGMYTVHAGSDGLFESDALAAGTYRVRVLAQGYAAVSFELAVPHHGTGNDLRISLRSLRALALDTYAHVMGPALAPQRIQASTVRETLAAAVSCGKIGTEVRDLAHATERIAYARPIPFESDLVDLQRAAASAARELGDSSPPPKDPELGR